MMLFDGLHFIEKRWRSELYLNSLPKLILLKKRYKKRLPPRLQQQMVIVPVPSVDNVSTRLVSHASCKNERNENDYDEYNL